MPNALKIAFHAYTLRKYEVDQKTYEERLMTALPSYDLTFMIGSEDPDSIDMPNAISNVSGRDANLAIEVASKIWSDILGIRCPLCFKLAKREELSLGNGFQYLCNPCGGVFEIGSGAQARANNRGLHPGIRDVVRHYLKEGNRPRIELNAGEFSVRILPRTTE